MHRHLLAILTLPLLGQTMNPPPQSAAQPSQPAHPIVYACHMKAMTPAQRRRQTEILLPALKSARLKSSELPNGYAFRFPADASTFATVTEWVGNERLCCPFFSFNIHVGDKTTPIVLEITGPAGIKQFIRAELPDLAG